MLDTNTHQMLAMRSMKQELREDLLKKQYRPVSNDFPLPENV